MDPYLADYIEEKEEDRLLGDKEAEEKLERGLSNRHLQLIAIGGAIGTGLFLGSGRSIHLAGPGILLAYVITGICVFFIMRALGEILISNTTKYHTFVDFTKDLLSERWAFFIGWSYWLLWVLVAMADLTAVGIYINFWLPDFPPWATALILLVILLSINLLTVKLFGEFEFWFALIKIVAIIGMIIVGLYLILTKFTWETSDGQQIVSSFSHLWDRGGFFPTGLGDWLLSFQMVVFSFAGVELIGLAAGETENPKKTLPKAMNSIPIRIFIFYLGSLIVIMCIYPWDIVDPDQSPFVNVFAAAGILAAATIVNFVVLTSAASACNSAIFSTSRMMYSSAKIGFAAKSMGKLSKRQVPANALYFSGIIIAIVLIIQYAVPSAAQVFLILSGMINVLFFFVWGTILIAQYRYRKTQPESVAKNIYKMPGAPFTTWIAGLFILFCFVILAFDADTRLAMYFTPIWFIILAISYNIIAKKRDGNISGNNTVTESIE